MKNKMYKEGQYTYILQENTKSDLKENWTSNKHQLGQQKSSKG